MMVSCMYVMCCGVSMCVLICAQEFKYPPHTHTYTSMRIEYYSYKRIYIQLYTGIREILLKYSSNTPKNVGKKKSHDCIMFTLYKATKASWTYAKYIAI